MCLVPDYMNGVIKKHELTRRDKEEDRMKHVRVNNANIEPVFFAYPHNDELNKIIAKYTAKKPEYDFIAPGDGFGHTFWVIDQEEDIRRITELFAQIPALLLPTVIIVQLQQLWLVPRKPSRIRIIAEMKSTIISWQSVSRMTS
mgnify:CR=1 FL=1